MPLRAAIISTLYETRVPLASQTNAAQQKAFRESLIQVLVKVSGDRDIGKDATIRNQLRQARDLIRSFRYDSADGVNYMAATFDEQRVNQLIASAGYPVWGKRRADTLVWMAYLDDESDQRQLITAGVTNTYSDLLKSAAERRGMPITLPLMDLQDAQTVNVYDVWGRFDDTIKLASQRYPNDNLVAVRIYDRTRLMAAGESLQDEMRWQLDWQILNQELAEQSTFFAPDRETLIAQFVDFLADKLAAKYAVEQTNNSSSGNQTLRLSILNVSSIEAYVSVRRFFESLALVNSVTLRRQYASVSEFDLVLSGSREDLLNVLLLDNKIRQKTNAFGQATNEMEFFWIP